MCLNLTYAEGRLWKRNATKIVADAKAAAAIMPSDPLLLKMPQLSSMVSEIDSIKKRHGLLIESALIFAINKIPNWKAAKEKIQITGGQAHLDCLAYNVATQQLYVFECKRGHGNQDRDRIQAIDNRLDRIKASVPAHVTTKGWSALKVQLFLLSFYGTTWKSKYPIYNAQTAAALFGPCVQTYLDHFMRHVEQRVHEAYDDKLSMAHAEADAIDSDEADDKGNIFDEIDLDGPLRNAEIRFGGDDVRIVDLDS